MMKKNCQLMALLLTLGISLLCRETQAQACFQDKLPTFLQSKDESFYEFSSWQSIIINAAADTLFVGGKTRQLKMFPGSGSNQLGVAARYSLTTQTYNWVKVFQDQEQKVKKITGLSLNYAETVLCIVGEQEKDSTEQWVYLFFLNPATGDSVYSNQKIKTKERLHLQSLRSVLLAGESRVYLTGRSWAQESDSFAGKPCISDCLSTSETSDTFQILIYDYKLGTIIKNLYSSISSGIGPGTGVSFYDLNKSTQINGQEAVWVFGAHSNNLTKNNWVLGIYNIDATLGTLSGFGIKYGGISGEYFVSSSSYQFIDAFDVVAPFLYFITTSRQQQRQYPGYHSLLCKAEFYDLVLQTTNCKKILANDFNVPQYFFQALLFRDDHFNIIYESKAETGIFRTDLVTQQKTSSISRNFKNYASVFVENTASVSEIFNNGLKVYKGYFAGTAKQFQNEDYTKLGNSETVITNLDRRLVAGVGTDLSFPVSKMVATIDSVLGSETCNSFAAPTNDLAMESITTTIEGYSNVAFTSFNGAQESFNFRTYDLDHSLRYVDSLCSTPASVTVKSSIIRDITGYKSDNNRYECPFEKFTYDLTCQDDSKLSYSIDESSITLDKSKTHIFTVDPTKNILIFKPKDVTHGVYNIKFVGTAPSGDFAQTTFQLTMIDGNAPSGYTPCSSCIGSTDATLQVTASNTPITKTFVIGASTDNQFTFDQMTVTGSSFCDALDIVYSLEADIDSTPALQVKVWDPTTSFFTFDAATRVVQWPIDYEARLVGNWRLKLWGKIKRNSVTQVAQAYSILDLTITAPCSKSQDALMIDAITIRDQTFYVGSSTGNQITFDKFQVTQGTRCRSEHITYTFQVDRVQNFITWNAQQRIIRWPSATSVNHGMYIIKVYGSILRDNVPETRTWTEFILYVKVKCFDSTDTVAITKTNSVMSQTYQIFSEPSSVVTAFSTAAQWCEDTDIQVTLSVIAIQGQSTEFITYNASTKTVQWETYDPSKVGDYLVSVTALVRRALVEISTSYEFTLTVVLPPEEFNMPPILQNLQTLVDNQNKLTIKVEDISEMTQLDFGPIKDYDGDSVYVQTVLVPSLFSFDQGVLQFDYKALMATGNEAQEIKYHVELTLTDSRQAVTQYNVFFVVPISLNPILPTPELMATNTTNTTNITASEKTPQQINQTEYGFQGVVIPDSTKVDWKAETPYWKSITTSNQGEVKIFFSELMIKPSNISLIDDKILDVSLVTSGAVDIKYLNYTWSVTEFTQSYFTIQLEFSDPLYVSSTGRSNYDKVQVKCKVPHLFISSKSFRSVQPEQTQIKELPTQLSGDRRANAALKSVTEVTASSGKSVVIGSFVLNVVLSASLSLLWGLINALQIIGHFPLFNLLVPASVESFFKAVNELAELKIIPTDEMVAYIIQNNDNSIFQQIGPYFLMILLGVFLIVLLMLMYKFQRYPTVELVYERISNQIFWNSTLRVIFEGYLEIGLSSILLINSGLDWSTHFERACSLFAIVMVVILCVTPIVVTLYLRSRHDEFRYTDFLDKFGDVMGNLSYRNKQSPFYISIFCYRRLAQIILIVFSAKYPWLQLQMQAFIGMFVVILLGCLNPMKLRLDRRLEYFNEATIMVCANHLFIFTDFVDDPIARNYAGYSLIGVTCFNIIINGSLMFRETLKTLYFKLKKFTYTQRNNRIIRKVQKARQAKKGTKELEKNMAAPKAAQQAGSNSQGRLLSKPQTAMQLEQSQLEVIDELPSEMEVQSQNEDENDAKWPKNLQLANLTRLHYQRYGKERSESKTNNGQTPGYKTLRYMVIEERKKYLDQIRRKRQDDEESKQAHQLQ